MKEIKVCSQCASLTNRPVKIKTTGKKWSFVCQSCFDKFLKKATAEKNTENLGTWRPY